MTTKKHAFYGILALVSLLGLGITQSAKANLVTNGGFETGDFTGWTQGGNLGFTSVSTITPHSGSWAARLGPIGSDGTLTQNLATTGGGFYVLDYWLSNEGGTPSDFSVKWGGVTIPGSILLDPPGFGYTEYTFTVFTSTATTALEFDFRQDPAYFHLDDISVTFSRGVPDAGSTLPLLGFALAGLGILRRKLGC